MKDFAFGDFLSKLRQNAGLSPAQLGDLLGLSEQTVAQWESGQAKPSLDMAEKLAEALGISLTELLHAPSVEKKITKIVITGGPCAGKTTAMSWIQNAFTRLGYTVLFVDETATQLISGGAMPWLSTSNRDFQLHLIRLQMAKEKAFTDIARTLKSDKVLIVCDRGIMDNCAYMTGQDFSWILTQLQTSKVALRDQYDAVFHLVTAARGAEKFYTLANNQARTETIEQAVALDDKLISFWTGQPHFRVIDNSSGFEEKMLRLIREITAFLGEPAPMEIERKFLIARPDPLQLAAMPHCEKVDIVQTYLKTDQASEDLRIRQRGANGHFIYYKTRKKRISSMKRVEEEEKLTQEQYLSLMVQADPAFRPIHKERYCLSANGLYYEIDLYPDWPEQAIMEIELHSEDQEITFPEGIRVIREVTEDNAYSNRELARIP